MMIAVIIDYSPKTRKEIFPIFGSFQQFLYIDEFTKGVDQYEDIDQYRDVLMNRSAQHVAFTTGK